MTTMHTRTLGQGLQVLDWMEEVTDEQYLK